MGYQRAYVLPLAGQVRRDGSADVQAPEGTGAGEHVTQEAGSGPGARHADLEGSRPSQLIAPARRRRTVDAVRRHLGHAQVSERRACRALQQPRSPQRYQPKRLLMDRALTETMRQVADARPRFGCERMLPMLSQSGWSVNLGTVHRLWKQEHMQVPRKQRNRRRLPGSSHNNCVRHRVMRRNHVWPSRQVDRSPPGT